MNRSKVIAHTLLAGFALLNLSSVLKANAETITVTRGSHGAAFIVESNNVPADAKAAPQSHSHEFPALISRGSHGAEQIASGSSKMMDRNPLSSVPTVQIRGPHGAGYIAE